MVLSHRRGHLPVQRVAGNNSGPGDVWHPLHAAGRRIVPAVGNRPRGRGWIRGHGAVGLCQRLPSRQLALPQLRGYRRQRSGAGRRRPATTQDDVGAGRGRKGHQQLVGNRTPWHGQQRRGGNRSFCARKQDLRSQRATLRHCPDMYLPFCHGHHVRAAGCQHTGNGQGAPWTHSWNWPGPGRRP